MAKYKLYNDDCFKVMKSLVSQGVKVDAIITDPPYIINYAHWDKEFDMALEFDFISRMVKCKSN